MGRFGSLNPYLFPESRGPVLPSLIWTRAIDDWTQDLTVATELNIDLRALLHIPCISFSAIEVTSPIPASNYVIFNSSHAVRFAMQQDRLAAAVRAAVKIFAIGPGTSHALQEFGLSSTPGYSGQGAKDLADQLLKSDIGGSFLIPTAKHAVFDTAAYLKEKRGPAVSAQSVVCYETIPKATRHDGTGFAPEIVDGIVNNLSGVICFASPSAVQGFNEIFNIQKHSLNRKLIALAIGQTTAKAVAQYFDNCQQALQNTTRSLMEDAAKTLKGLK